MGGSGICLMETTTYIYKTREHLTNSTIYKEVKFLLLRSSPNNSCQYTGVTFTTSMQISQRQLKPLHDKFSLAGCTSFTLKNIIAYTKPCMRTKSIIVITIPLTEFVILNMGGICYPSNNPVLMRFFPFYATHNPCTSKRSRILPSELTQVITQIW